MSEMALSVRALEKRFDETQVLSGLELEVPSACTLGLVGPNGVGKSTAIRCILGLVFPDAGSIEVAGVDALRDSVRARKNIGFLPGETSVYRWMTGREFLRFGLAFHDEIDNDFLDACLARFELPIDRKLRSYSSGQKQMLALCVALAPIVPLYILDEPEKALDASKRHTLREIVSEMKARGRTLLISSHHIFELEQFADRFAFLHEGRVLAQSEVEQRIDVLSQRVRARFENRETPPEVSTSARWKRNERDWILDVPADEDARAVARALLEHAPSRLEFGQASLQEVYEDLYVLIKRDDGQNERQEA